jgi:hypothetical protein
VNRLGEFLDAHNGLRITALCASFIIAAPAAYMGAAVYALTTGPKAIGDYMRDRGLALCLLAFATILNFGAAWVFSRKHQIGGLLPRLLLSLLLTACGGVLVFGAIVACVMLSKGRWTI